MGVYDVNEGLSHDGDTVNKMIHRPNRATALLCKFAGVLKLYMPHALCISENFLDEWLLKCCNPPVEYTMSVLFQSILYLMLVVLLEN